VKSSLGQGTITNTLKEIEVREDVEAGKPV
jgi:hypothetical protein